MISLYTLYKNNKAVFTEVKCCYCLYDYDSEDSVAILWVMAQCTVIGGYLCVTCIHTYIQDFSFINPYSTLA